MLCRVHTKYKIPYPQRMRQYVYMCVCAVYVCTLLSIAEYMFNIAKQLTHHHMQHMLEASAENRFLIKY